jgi:hypothetical protein
MKVLFANNKGLNFALNRASTLPEKFKNIFQLNDLSISTYGDLAFVWSAWKNKSLDQGTDNKFTVLFSELKEMGFDESILEKIK